VPRETVPVRKTDRGDDTHPAFGMVQVHRYSNTPGAILFDSDIRHGHTVALTIHRATRKRDLARDWIHSDLREIAQIEMSEAQWASLVSSMGSSGVPCTIRATETNPRVPELPYDPRLAHSMKEVHEAADKTFGKIEQAMQSFDALDPKATAKEKREALQRLRSTIFNATPNVAFTAKSLVEHAENVVQRSRADIEAMAIQAAEEMGLPTGTRLLELDAVEEEA
jgi:hypothetical protein